MRWATDNPDLFAIMEKTRMYIAGITDDQSCDSVTLETNRNFAHGFAEHFCFWPILVNFIMLCRKLEVVRNVYNLDFRIE